MLNEKPLTYCMVILDEANVCKGVFWLFWKGGAHTLFHPDSMLMMGGL
jgi:hypothetical protein